MQATNSLQKQAAFRKRQVRKIVTFLVITFSLSLVFKLLIVVFNPNSIQEIAKNFGWQALPPGIVIPLYVFFLVTFGLLQACLPALGEEIGWRGFLVPELAKTTTFSKTALISGVVWAVWHYPEIIFGDYNGGTPIWYSVFCFTLSVIAISFPMAWLRF